MKYRLYCETDGKQVEHEGLLIIESCPDNPNHVITPGSATVIVNNDTLFYINGITKDYKEQRLDLIAYVQENFSTMTSDQLRVAAEHFAVPKEVRDMFFTQEEQIQNGYIFHQRATAARNARWELSAVELYNYISLSDAFIIGREITQLCFEYLHYGIEGTAEGDGEGIFDYLLATSGTSYETTGLAASSYQTVVSGVTIQEVAQHMYELLKYGKRI